VNTPAGIGMTSQRTRQRMVDRLRKAGIKSEIVLKAMGDIPRHSFVEEALGSRAYEDSSLPIGYGQTISQPFSVARICELALNAGNLTRVLDVGTGCGYQAAVLAAIAQYVYSIERISRLLSKTRIRLKKLNYRNISLRNADGSEDFSSIAPLDAIVLAAGTGEIPDHLVKFLRLGGRMVLPLGSKRQRLTEIVKTEDSYEIIEHEEVSFVPLLSGVSRG
jgi:protein-L-isoaspartate(D-aspartate) O-methyltransferase